MASIIKLWNEPSVHDMGNTKRVIRDSMVEFLATTVFIFAGTLSAVTTGRRLSSDGVDGDVARILPIAMSFGLSILALVYSIGHLTGGHMNPGVSLLMVLKRQMSFQKMACYWVAQFVGSLLASSLVWGCTSSIAGDVVKADGTVVQRPPFLLGATTMDTALSQGNGFLLEFMGSFFFYFVISQTALDARGIAKSMFPAIPIGLTLVVVHICLITFTGCGVNPARTFGPAMVTCMADSGGDLCEMAVGSWWWIYWIGPFAASFAVAEVTTLMEWDVSEAQETAPTQEKSVADPSKTIAVIEEGDVSEQALEA